MADIALDPVTGDLALQGFDLGLVSGAEEVAQRVRSRLRLFQGEWFLDRTAGVPYYQEVFRKPASAPILDAVFKDAILGTRGVRRLTRFDLALDGQLRQLTVTVTIETDSGETVDLQEDLSP